MHAKLHGDATPAALGFKIGPNVLHYPCEPHRLDPVAAIRRIDKRQVDKLADKTPGPVNARRNMRQRLVSNIILLTPQRHLSLGLQSGKRGLQLVGGIGDKRLLTLTGCLHPQEEGVQRSEQWLDFTGRVPVFDGVQFIRRPQPQ